jgi:hypothetical protein
VASRSLYVDRSKRSAILKIVSHLFSVLSSYLLTSRRMHLPSGKSPEHPQNSVDRAGMRRTAFGRTLFAFLCLAFAVGVLAPGYSARAAFPTTGILDNFNRADENPLSNGGKWTCPMRAADNNLRVLSNQVGDAANADCYWSDAIFGPDSEAYLTITTKPSDGNCIAVVARISGAGSTISGYWGEFCSAAGTDTWDLYRFDNGTPNPYRDWWNRRVDQWR